MPYGTQPETISIHALREEGDEATIAECRIFLISIHALREEGDVSTTTGFYYEFLFLSTPSARRATTHPHHGWTAQQISIHALREEGDDSC